MKTLISILKIYGIKKVLINDNENLDVVILKKDKELSLNDWLNLNIALRRTYKKEVNYLTEKEALFIYENDLSRFVEVNYE